MVVGWDQPRATGRSRRSDSALLLCPPPPATITVASGRLASPEARPSAAFDSPSRAATSPSGSFALACRLPVDLATIATNGKEFAESSQQGHR